MNRADLRIETKVAIQRLASLVRPPRNQTLTLETLLANGTSSEVLEGFHRLWYASDAVTDVQWMGQPVLKSPFDLWVYQQIIVDCRPDVLIETGTHRGGSALFFASIARLAGLNTTVLTIDFNPKIEYDMAAYGIHSIAGISTASTTTAQVAEFVRGLRTPKRPPSVMVVLDSDHSKDNVSKELAFYGALVTPGQYLVVEDTNVNGHPVMADHGPGPYEAVQDFLRHHSEFHPDLACERFLFTQNPGGWLKREQ